MAKRLIFCGEIVEGCTAQALGIVQWAVPRDELASKAGAWTTGQTIIVDGGVHA